MISPAGTFYYQRELDHGQRPSLPMSSIHSRRGLTGRSDEGHEIIAVAGSMLAR
jgi:hypothetical protein